MNLPIPLSGQQSSRLDALLLRGDPDLFVLDTEVGGSPLYVLVARGPAREWAMATLYGAEPTEKPVVDPPAKVVPVSTGARAAGPLGKPAA